MARAGKMDALDKFRWQVEIKSPNGGQPSGIRAGFATMQTPSYQITTREYREGGAHLHPRQIVDSITYSTIELTRGVTAHTGFQMWAQGPFDMTQISNDVVTTETHKKVFDGPELVGLRVEETNQLIVHVDQYRQDVVIKHLNRGGSIVKIYTLKNCIPIQYKPASDFDASSDDLVSIESLVLKYESFTVTSPSGSLLGKFVGDLFKDILP